MTQPTPTHQWTWTGSRDLPTWLTGHHHWHDDQLVIHTPDRYVHPEPGWWLIGWSDGTVTAASPTSGERVYGADGIADRLARAETATDGELRRQLDAAIAALGRSETELARLRTALNTPPADDTQPTRHVHVTITNPDAYTANRAALSLVDWLAAEFPAHHVTTDAREWEQPGPAATQATEPVVDRQTAVVLAALHRSAEADVSRVISLYERWVKAGPPPLGTSMSRWWDKRLVELHAALNPKEN